MQNIKATDLYKAMQASGNYPDEAAIIETIEEMREYVADGEDPEEVLRDEGFEPDYILDLMDWP